MVCCGKRGDLSAGARGQEKAGGVLLAQTSVQHKVEGKHSSKKFGKGKWGLVRHKHSRAGHPSVLTVIVVNSAMYQETTTVWKGSRE